VAQNIEIAAHYNKLFMLHANDNYNMWDDDMIVGSLRLTEYIEMFYSIIDMIGFAKLGDVIANGDPCEMVRVVRESVLR
jgi:hypothetical protein